MATVNTDTHLTSAEAAAEITRITGVHISVASVRKYCQRYGTDETPQIEAEHVGRDWWIHPNAIDKFCEQRRPKGRPAANH